MERQHFSLLLGELLARKRSVLYIGFDELPFWDEEENISEEQGEKGTLSDAYFYWQRTKLKGKISPVLVSHWHGVDVLTGMNCPEDLCAIQPEEWSQLILKNCAGDRIRSDCFRYWIKAVACRFNIFDVFSAICASAFRTFGKRSAKTF